MSGLSIAMRGSSFLAQLVLGGILSEGDFGLFAAALGFVAIGASLRSVLRTALIEATAKSPELVDRLYSNTMWAVMAFAAVGVLASPLLGAVFDNPDLPPLLIPLLILVPLQIVPVVGMARINEALQFQRFGRIVGSAAVLRHAVTVVAALLGFGPYSFVLGVGAAVVTEIVSVRLIVGSLPRLMRPTFFSGFSLKDRTGDRRWIWPTAIALSLAVSGDYLGASAILTVEVVGLYFFAYQLTGALFEPMNTAANTVLVPAFVKIDDLEKRRSSFVEIVQTLSVFSTLFFVTAAVTVAPITHLLWGGKWDGSIFAILAFAIYAPIRLVHPISQSIARGCGYWSLFASDMVLAGAVTVVSAVIGAAVGGLETLVIFVVCGHFLVTMASLLRLASRLGAPWVDVLLAVLTPWSIGLVGLELVHLTTAGIDSVDVGGAVVRFVLLVVYLSVALVVPFRRRIMATVQPILQRA